LAERYVVGEDVRVRTTTTTIGRGAKTRMEDGG
jgi:hypothetical protein